MAELLSSYPSRCASVPCRAPTGRKGHCVLRCAPPLPPEPGMLLSLIPAGASHPHPLADELPQLRDWSKRTWLT